jgi:hypothetical protein
MAGGGGSQTTVQRTEPWSRQVPYLVGDEGRGILGVFPEALRLYQAPGPSYFPGATVAPTAPEREMALAAQAARALHGSPLAGLGAAELGRTLGGAYLTGNPFLQGAIDAASRGLVRNYQSAVAPGIDSAFAGAGRYGSGAHLAAHEAAQRNLAAQLGDIGANLGYQGYAAERANMLSALGLAPTFAQGDYLDIAQLDAVGRAREAMAQALLDDQVARWNFAQQLPADKLRQYAALIQGNFGGTETTTQPFSAGAGILSGIETGVGLGSTIGTALGAGGGPPGMIIGGLLGALLGGI